MLFFFFLQNTVQGAREYREAVSGVTSRALQTFENLYLYLMRQEDPLQGHTRSLTLAI